MLKTIKNRITADRIESPRQDCVNCQNYAVKAGEWVVIFVLVKHWF